MKKKQLLCEQVRKLWGMVLGKGKWMKPAFLTLAFVMAACTVPANGPDTPGEKQPGVGFLADATPIPEKEPVTTSVEESLVTEKLTPTKEPERSPVTTSSQETQELALEQIPEYSGMPYALINDNEPYFTEDELTTTPFEFYSELDALGRCGVTYACVGRETMPTEERGSIGQIKPTGWQTVKYEIVEGKYLYNRCHLIGFQLTGENANEKNLITGTRELNMLGMLPFENMVADYVTETGNHVMYRVTPFFDGDNLVADGVLIEAKSVEDDGDGILFNVFSYNVQDGIVIDYANGNSRLADGFDEDEPEVTKEPEVTPAPILAVSDTSVEITGSTASIDVINNSERDFTMKYVVSNPDIVKCAWGDWGTGENSNTLPLILTPLSNGETTVRISIVGSDDYVDVEVKVSAFTEEEVPEVTSSYVWISATGSKYHSINNCGRMNPSKARRMTERDAVAGGYEACEKCY